MSEKRKNYLITGGSSGIGLAVARKLASQGARVVLVARHADVLERAVESLPGEGHEGIACDLAQLASIGGVFDRLMGEGVVLDGFVHSAGMAPLCLVRDNTPELAERVFRLNVLSFIELVKFFQLETISREGARIVAIASVTAKGSGYRQTLYGASKAALIAAVKLMAKELLNRNIRVNCVSPGVADTPMLDKLRAESANLDDKIKNSQPLGAVPPDNIAGVVAGLLGENSDYVTGAEWFVDGGAMLK